MTFRHGLTFDGQEWFMQYRPGDRVTGRIGGQGFGGLEKLQADTLYPKLCSLTAREALGLVKLLQAGATPLF